MVEEVSRHWVVATIIQKHHAETIAVLRPSLNEQGFNHLKSKAHGIYQRNDDFHYNKSTIQSGDTQTGILKLIRPQPSPRICNPANMLLMLIIYSIIYIRICIDMYSIISMYMSSIISICIVYCILYVYIYVYSIYGYNMVEHVTTIYNISFPYKTRLHGCLPLKNLDWAACHLGSKLNELPTIKGCESCSMGRAF